MDEILVLLFLGDPHFNGFGVGVVVVPAVEADGVEEGVVEGEFVESQHYELGESFLAVPDELKW